MTDVDCNQIDEYLKPSGHWAWKTDHQHRFEYLSDNFAELTGIDPAGILGRARTHLIKPDTNTPLSPRHRDMLDMFQPFERFKFPWEAKDGRARWFESSGAPRFDENGAFLGYQGIAREITAEIEAEARPGTIDRERRLQQTLLAQIERVSKIGAWRWTMDGNHFHWSDEVFRIYDLPIGTPITVEHAFDAYDGEARAIIEAAIEESLQSHKPYDVTTRFTSAKGTARWVRAIGVPEVIGQEVARFYGTFQDVTEQRNRQLEIHRLAMTDPLTGVANRTAFNERLNALVQRPLPTWGTSILCIIDIDDFRRVNDQYGHHVGDDLLRLFSECLVGNMNEDWFFARIGGDEFGIIVDQIERAEDFAAHMNALLSDVAMKVQLRDISINVSATAGYVVSPNDGRDAEVLLRRADFALYDARRQTDASVRRFEMSMEEVFRRRVLVAREFRDALRNEQIVPHYQPVIKLDTGQVAGMEALARWHHPVKGILSPAIFTEVFGDHEICVSLTELMLRRICEDMRHWIGHGKNFGRVGLNVTAADLQQPGFALRIVNMLARHGLRPHHLLLEMTETTVFGNADSEVIGQVRQLRDAGVAIALDDFGTGYSSLTHLKSVPFDILKIDRSFVKDMMRSQSSRAIVHSLIKLGDDIGYSTVAEGIEFKAEAKYLRDIGCKNGQGYLFHKPMPKSEIDNLLAHRAHVAV